MDELTIVRARVVLRAAPGGVEKKCFVFKSTSVRRGDKRACARHFYDIFPKLCWGSRRKVEKIEKKMLKNVEKCLNFLHIFELF